MADKKKTDKHRRSEAKKQRNILNNLRNAVKKAIHVYKHYVKLNRPDVGMAEGRKCAQAHSEEALVKFEVQLNKLKKENESQSV